jgi:hypothetical protein
MRRIFAIVLAGTFAVGCDADNPEELKAQFEALNTEARALVMITGCTAVTDCKSAAMGAKACGGPREYLVYCSKTTDQATLLGKLDTAIRLEKAYNDLTDAVSTCEAVLAPELQIAGGECKAK